MSKQGLGAPDVTKGTPYISYTYNSVYLAVNSTRQSFCTEPYVSTDPTTHTELYNNDSYSL